MKYPLSQPDIGEIEERMVLDALRSGWVSHRGSYVGRLEQEFAAFCGARFAVACSSGTAALHLALRCLDIRDGDEVVVPSLTYVASGSAVAYTGAVPVIADVERDSWCLDPEQLARVITPRTKAVIVVHLYGQPANMDRLMAVAGNIPLISDAAQAQGALYKGRKIGSITALAAFSFYGNKPITTGEGGILTTTSPAMARRARFLGNQAAEPGQPYWHNEIGYSYRMGNLQAALGLAQLTRIGTTLAHHQRVYEWYCTELADFPGLEFNPNFDWSVNSYWVACVLLPPAVDRAKILSGLARAGIEARPFFHPLHLMPPFRSESTAKSCPVSEDLSARGICLPSSGKLQAHDVHFIAGTLRNLLRA